MKKLALKNLGKLITSLLGFIGVIVTSCAEYGSPHAL